MQRQVMADPLRISQRQWDAIAEHVRAGVPLEVCGLLGGLGRRVRGVYPVQNIASDPDTGYYADPQMLFDVLTALDKKGWELVGIYHSHPPGARSDPSPADIALSNYPGVVHVLVVPSADGEIESLRGFLIEQGREPVEVPVVVDAQED